MIMIMMIGHWTVDAAYASDCRPHKAAHSRLDWHSQSIQATERKSTWNKKEQHEEKAKRYCLNANATKIYRYYL